MFLRIFRFHRKKNTGRPSPSCPNCNAKVSKLPDPLSVSLLHSASAPGPRVVLDRSPTLPSPISLTSGDTDQAAAHTGWPSSPKSDAVHPPVSPRKKRHVSFAPMPSKAGSPPPCSPYQSPYPSPSLSELSGGPMSSVSTLVDAGVDQVHPNPPTDTSVSGNRLDCRPVSGDDDACAVSGDQLASSPSMCKKPTPKARHISMISLARPKVNRVSIQVPPLPLTVPTSISHTNRNSAHPSSPTSRRTSKRFSVMSLKRADSVKTKKEKRASRWSQHMNSPETQEVLRALRDMQ